MLRIRLLSPIKRRIHTTVCAQNHYRTLKLKREASVDDIKTAYKSLAREYHPDRPGGDKDKFIAVKEAFEVLKNETARIAYDAVFVIGRTTFVPQMCEYGNFSVRKLIFTL